MTFSFASAPIDLLAIQTGRVTTPAVTTAAKGASQLDAQQRAIQIGEPVPIVFARRRNGKGGILISPGATEARFTNDINNAVTARYVLALSEGRLDSIPVKDVFQGSCRIGAHTQSYNTRAGSWLPGNYIVARDGYDLPECPYYCGTVGLYSGMTTASFRVTVPDGVDQWNRQVHFFIRGGMWVTRLVDGIVGPSDNFADLANWMIQSTGRVPASLIDSDALESAALFLEANSFTCNCTIQDSSNYADLIAQWAPYFLLCESNTNGKRGLRPVLPTNSDGTIKTTPIAPAYTFDESIILHESVEITYTTLPDRQLFTSQVTWRQETGDDIGYVKTSEVRYAGRTIDGPYESHDLSAFCTNETHAVKIGAYILSKRAYTTHSIRFAARPEKHNKLISPGDIIQVKLQREATDASASVLNYMYQVERITKTLTGDVTYECTHFPVDSQGRSLTALDVASAVGPALPATSNRTGLVCDLNSASDGSIPSEDPFDYDGFTFDDLPIDLSGGLISDSSGYDPAANTPSDNADSTVGLVGLPDSVTQTNNQLTYNAGCPGAYIEWYLVDDATGETTQVAAGIAQTYIITNNATAAGVSVLGVGRCPDGTTSQTPPFKVEATGYGGQAIEFEQAGTLVFGLWAKYDYEVDNCAVPGVTNPVSSGFAYASASYHNVTGFRLYNYGYQTIDAWTCGNPCWGKIAIEVKRNGVWQFETYLGGPGVCQNNTKVRGWIYNGHWVMQFNGQDVYPPDYGAGYPPA
jgi:hypothetical protein